MGDARSATPLTRAQRLHRQAVEEFNAGKPAVSSRTLRRALATLAQLPDPTGPSPPERVLAARIWISIALNEAEMRSYDRGMQALAEAERAMGAHRDERIRVLLHCQRGALELRQGRLASARAELVQAAALIAHAEPPDACVVLLNLGTVYLYRGELTKARSYLTRAATSAADLGDLVREFKARHNAAYVDYLAGDLPLALRGMQDALALNAPISRGVALLDRARVLSECGLARQASQVLGAACDVFAAERRRHEQAEALLARSETALLLDDLPGARTDAARARAIFTSIGNPHWRRLADLQVLEIDIARRRVGPDVSASARRLSAEFTDAGTPPAAQRAALAGALAELARGAPVAAAAALRDALSHGRPRQISARLHLQRVRTEVYAAEGRLGPARRAAQSGLDELAAHRARFGSVDLRAASALHGRQLARIDLELALASGQPAAVFAALERGRAGTSRIVPVHGPQDAALAERLGRLRQVADMLHDPGLSASRRSELDREYAALQRDFAEATWQTPGVHTTLGPAPIDDVHAALAAADATMLVLVRSGAAVHALILADGHIRLHRLGAAAAEIAEHARRIGADLDVCASPALPASMSQAVRSSLRRSLGIIDAAVRSCHDGRRLIVVPHGDVSSVPWNALPSLRGVPLTVAMSATSWLRTAAAAGTAGDGPPRVVAIAGPYLSRADQEVRQIAAGWSNATVISSDAMSSDAMSSEVMSSDVMSTDASGHRDSDGGQLGSGLLHAVAGADVLHVAAHGRHDLENPLFSRLDLAGGPLFAYDFEHERHPVSHVILSACELGRSTLSAAEDRLGWTSALLHLGTQCVVAAVARVGDDVAAETMIRYHGLLRAGLDSASALAEAVAGETEVMAPFVCFGGSWTRRDGAQSTARTSRRAAR